MESQTPEKTKIQDLNYYFVDLSGKRIKVGNINNVVAYVDEKILTETPILNLFKKVDVSNENKLRGFSILQHLVKKGNNLYTDDDNLVQFLDTSSKTIFTLEIDNPFIMKDSKYLTAEEVEGYTLLLLYEEIKKDLPKPEEATAAATEEVNKQDEAAEEVTEVTTTITETVVETPVEETPKGTETTITEEVTTTTTEEVKVKTPEENLKDKHFNDNNK